MADSIFISYRRDDEQGYAARLYERLMEIYGREHVFFDVDSVPVGFDFVRYIDQRVSLSDIVLVVIGRNWLNAQDERGRRRVDNPGDYVRIEVESALKRKKLVVPILVQGAAMPLADELPLKMRPLSRRNAFLATHVGFRAEVDWLIAQLRLHDLDLAFGRDAVSEGDPTLQTASVEPQHIVLPPVAIKPSDPVDKAYFAPEHPGAISSAPHNGVGPAEHDVAIDSGGRTASEDASVVQPYPVQTAPYHRHTETEERASQLFLPPSVSEEALSEMLSLDVERALSNHDLGHRPSISGSKHAESGAMHSRATARRKLRRKNIRTNIYYFLAALAVSIPSVYFMFINFSADRPAEAILFGLVWAMASVALLAHNRSRRR